MAVEWFYLLLKPLLLALVDHVVFTCFQVSLHKFLIYMILHQISNATQTSNTALETIALVMYDPTTCLYVVLLFFLWLCEFH